MGAPAPVREPGRKKSPKQEPPEDPPPRQDPPTDEPPQGPDRWEPTDESEVTSWSRCSSPLC